MAEWKCPRCSAQNAPAATSCYFCGAERDPSTPEAQHADGAWSAGTGDAQLAARLPGFGPGGLIGGLAVGALAALVGTMVWYLVVALSSYQVGFVAIAIGWLVGSASVFGARGRVSWPLIGASVAFTLIALVVSEYLILYHVASEMLRAEGVEIELLLPLELMADIVIGSVQEDPVTLMFWGLALAAAAWIPFREMRPAAPVPALQP